ncbi:hypothetical protein LSUE1_G002434 [Lachnellula suecica]|uniref:Uncharacterized protein n=1 Tax=Lachnellula suecica TaxID=602035 RepID=A0A8T9CBL5_9HELO|nr:hypothetical protein LSUE1_G002434 [Lachnellula suecica]
MAQGAVAPGAPPNGIAPGLTAEEKREMLEYEKIIQFRDAIMAGTHPRIKIPSHLVGKQANATRHFSSPTVSTPRANNFAQRSTPNSQHEDASSSFYRSPNNNRPGPAAQISKSAKSEINPILLEKSDDLIKAEMQLQRQRLERALRDQIEKQRNAAKAAMQTSESLPNFDISEVLSKAQAIAHPSPAAQPAVAEETPASDSFDENTFYSSRHDSSDWSNASQGQKEPVEVQSGGLVSVGGRAGEQYSTQSHIQDRQKGMASASLSTNNLPAAQQHSQHLTDAAPIQTQRSGMGSSASQVPGLVAAGRNSTDLPHHPPATGAHNNSSMGQNGIASKQNGDHATVRRTTDDLLRQAFEEGLPPVPPVIRNHNLSPIAPQPARVSPLATAREPPILRENILVDEAAPAQVAALRNKTTGISSTDSSPKGAKGAEKKKGGNKKKKRKANNGAATPDSPYIKPEPRSPSPFAVAPLPRPQKRQRQSGQYAAELNYDEPRYDAEGSMQARAPAPYTEVRESRTYQRVDDPYETTFRRPAPPLRRVEDDSYRRTASDTYARGPQSPVVYATPSYAGEGRSVRAASHAIVERRIEEPRYYREPIQRTVVRPDADRERSRSPIMHDRRSPVSMGPPRQAVRIVRDEFGNEYLDPTPAPSMRQSVAPQPRYREEVIYERPRAVSGRVEVYEEDGVIYRRPSPPPPMAIPRRVVTQPEYAMAPPSGYRSYREREYSIRPAGEEYVQRRQIYEEPVREYAPRAQSVRPEPVRYEIRDEAPREYAPRAPVAREEIPQDYMRAASVRPDAIRYEVRDEAPREYAPRIQALREEVPREYISRPGSVRPDQTRYEDHEYIKAPVAREEIPRDYARAGSVRPDAVRYEVPREYGPRLQSVRPEAPPREYASSVHPDARREMVPQGQREFSVRPVDSLNRREQVPVAKGERYYEEVLGQRPPPVAFIERPRARESSVLVYADDARREVYR